jgi:hypothetical protein
VINLVTRYLLDLPVWICGVVVVAEPIALRVLAAVGPREGLWNRTWAARSYRWVLGGTLLAAAEAGPRYWPHMCFVARFLWRLSYLTAADWAELVVGQAVGDPAANAVPVLDVRTEVMSSAAEPVAMALAEVTSGIFGAREMLGLAQNAAETGPTDIVTEALPTMLVEEQFDVEEETGLLPIMSFEESSEVEDEAGRQRSERDARHNPPTWLGFLNRALAVSGGAQTTFEAFMALFSFLYWMLS